MTATHRYGPHQPEAAPNAVTVLSSSVHSCGWTNGHEAGCIVSQYPTPEVRAIPPELVKQRADSNELARKRSAGEGTLHHCDYLRREVWTPGRFCQLCRKVVSA